MNLPPTLTIATDPKTGANAGTASKSGSGGIAALLNGSGSSAVQDPHSAQAKRLFSLLLSGQVKSLAPGLQGQAGLQAGQLQNAADAASPGSALQPDSAQGQDLPADGNTLPLAELFAALLAGRGSDASAALAEAAGLQGSGSTHGDRAGGADKKSATGAAVAATLAAFPFLPNIQDAGVQTDGAAALDQTLAADMSKIAGLATDRGAARLVQAAIDQLTSVTDAGHDHTGAQHAKGAQDAASAVNPGLHHVAPKSDAGSQVRASAPVVLQMDQPMHKADWSQELGNRILWMTRENVQAAQLRINPPHLGPVEVRVSVHHDAATVSFVAHHVHARDAIEAAIPRLREMMGENGFSQTSVSVSGQAASGHQQNPGTSNGGTAAENRGSDFPDGDEVEAIKATALQAPSLGMVDYFA
ncbi:MAG: flagellar hook-length control protein FliK [Gammaproteobacteria bacterium]